MQDSDELLLPDNELISGEAAVPSRELSWKLSQELLSERDNGILCCHDSISDGTYHTSSSVPPSSKVPSDIELEYIKGVTAGDLIHYLSEL